MATDSGISIESYWKELFDLIKLLSYDIKAKAKLLL